MLESIMTGKTAAELQGLANSFELMGQTPEHVDKFNAAMTELTRLVGGLESPPFPEMRQLEVAIQLQRVVALCDGAWEVAGTSPRSLTSRTERRASSRSPTRDALPPPLAETIHAERGSRRIQAPHTRRRVRRTPVRNSLRA